MDIKEIINQKLNEEKNSIVYKSGSHLPDINNMQCIIIVGDIIYRDNNGNIEVIENKQEVINKVWEYINLMQGNIRAVSEKIKDLPYIKATRTDDIKIQINDEVLSLSGLVVDESSKEFYSKVVNDILEIIK